MFSLCDYLQDSVITLVLRPLAEGIGGGIFGGSALCNTWPAFFRTAVKIPVSSLRQSWSKVGGRQGGNPARQLPVMN